VLKRKLVYLSFACVSRLQVSRFGISRAHVQPSTPSWYGCIYIYICIMHAWIGLRSRSTRSITYSLIKPLIYYVVANVLFSSQDPWDFDSVAAMSGSRSDFCKSYIKR